MNIQAAYLCLADHTHRPATARVEAHGAIRAVYLDGCADAPLDPEFGAGIDLVIDDMTAFMADYRYSEFWCMPAFGQYAADIPDETQGLIARRADGTFAVLLPVVSEQYKCVLKGAEGNTLTARLFSWCDGLADCHALAFLWAEGHDPYALLADCTKLALSLLGTGHPTREERPYPALLEYLGWCSWDAMEIRVNEADLLAKCREFQDKGIPVRWAIIDDMWAEVHDFYDAKYDSRPEMFRLMHSSKLYSFGQIPGGFLTAWTVASRP